MKRAVSARIRAWKWAVRLSVVIAVLKAPFDAFDTVKRIFSLIDDARTAVAAGAVAVLAAIPSLPDSASLVDAHVQYDPGHGISITLDPTATVYLDELLYKVKNENQVNVFLPEKGTPAFDVRPSITR